MRWPAWKCMHPPLETQTRAHRPAIRTLADFRRSRHGETMPRPAAPALVFCHRAGPNGSLPYGPTASDHRRLPWDDAGFRPLSQALFYSGSHDPPLSRNRSRRHCPPQSCADGARGDARTLELSPRDSRTLRFRMLRTRISESPDLRGHAVFSATVIFKESAPLSNIPAASRSPGR